MQCCVGNAAHMPHMPRHASVRHACCCCAQRSCCIWLQADQGPNTSKSYHTLSMSLHNATVSTNLSAAFQWRTALAVAATPGRTRHATGPLPISNYSTDLARAHTCCDKNASLVCCTWLPETACLVMGLRTTDVASREMHHSCVTCPYMTGSTAAGSRLRAVPCWPPHPCWLCCQL